MGHCWMTLQIHFPIRQDFIGLLLSFTLLFPHYSNAQDSLAIKDLDAKQTDIADVIRNALGNDPKEKPSGASVSMVKQNIALLFQNMEGCLEVCFLSMQQQSTMKHNRWDCLSPSNWDTG